MAMIMTPPPALFAEPPPDEPPEQYATTSRLAYSEKELPQSSNLGRRVMMTQDMHDIKGAGDGLWRKEHNVVSRTLVVAERPRRDARSVYDYLVWETKM